MTSVLNFDVTDIQFSKLDRWRLIQRVLQDFWRRWAVEYVAGLQSRVKWKKEQPNLQVEDLVILRDENLSPLKWKLGRVTELCPGNDNAVRVVTIRTKDSCFKRSIAKLCKLPILLEEHERN